MQAIRFGAAALALACLSSAPAQAASGSKEGYLTDKAGNIVTSKTTGLCVRTKQWTLQNADPECLKRAGIKR